jgi:hypothetical protein|tara:strand:+ start:465 stop:713 length:249 start_codon:yes stop_codon:yes gene_type:complete
MTDIIGTDGKEIKSESELRKDEVLKLLKHASENVNKCKNVEGCIVLLKMNGDYARYSTTIDDIVKEVGQLEMLKTDIINRTR